MHQRCPTAQRFDLRRPKPTRENDDNSIAAINATDGNVRADPVTRWIAGRPKIGSSHYRAARSSNLQNIAVSPLSKCVNDA